MKSNTARRYADDASRLIGRASQSEVFNRAAQSEGLELLAKFGKSISSGMTSKTGLGIIVAGSVVKRIIRHCWKINYR